jgi:hypothetical protein
MSSSEQYSIEILNNIIVYIYRYITPLIYILGNVGNLLSVVIFLKKSWQKNVCVFYFLIAICLSTVYLNFTILGFTFVIGFNIKLQDLNVIMCKLYYFVPFFVSTLLPTVLILATLDRLFISYQNVSTGVYNSKRFAYRSVSISTFFWFIFNFPMLIEVNHQEIIPSVFSCSFKSTKSYHDFVYYSIMIINISFCLIIFILCIFSFEKLHHIQKIRQQQQQRAYIQPITKKDFQILRCLFVHIIIYMIATVFSAVLSIYSVATKSKSRIPLEQAVHDFFSDLFTVFSFSYYGASFFIFFIVSKAFRSELKRLVSKIFGKLLQCNRKNISGRMPNQNNV